MLSQNCDATSSYSTAGMVVYTEEELAQKTAKELEDILLEMGLPKTGNKSVMSARIIEKQCSFNARKAAVKNNLALDDEEEDDEKETLEEVGKELRLSEQTIKAFSDNGFSTIGDLKMLDASDLKELKISRRDEKKLLIFLQKIPEPTRLKPTILEVEQSKKNKSATHAFDEFLVEDQIQERRMRQPSSHGEFESIAEEEGRFELPSRARDLPRPHLTCVPRLHSSDAKRKIDPLDLSFWEFMAESMRLLNRLFRSSTHSDVAREYVEYLEFLTTRNLDYNEKAVMLFDNDFRNRAAHERLSLSDNDTRRCIADRYFHAAQRKEQLNA